MTTQRFFSGKFNAADMAQTQQAAKTRSEVLAGRDASKPASFGMALATEPFLSHRWASEWNGGDTVDYIARVNQAFADGVERDSGERSSWAIGNPAIVMRMDGTWDVVAFAPYRRIGERLSRTQADFLVAATKNRDAVRKAAEAKVARSIRGLR